jgi:hypothetical protein
VANGGAVLGNDFTQVNSTNITLTLTNNATLGWTWATNYWLALSTNGQGSVDKTNSWNGAGSANAVTATPSNHWHFTGWSGNTGGCTIVGNVVTAAMTQARSIVANFAIDQHTLQIASLYGVAVPGVGFYTNDYGTTLTNRVSDQQTVGTTQYVCTGWAMTGNAPFSGTATNLTMTVTNDAVLAWTWTTNYWLAPAAGPNGSVNVAAGWRALGSNVTITATASNYYHFGAWGGDTGGCTIASNQITAQMDGARAILANFSANVATNNTPHWWLAQYGLPLNDAGALYDDGDGMLAWEEYIADTDPTNALSVLEVTNIVFESGNVCVGWSGGQQVWQYLECATNLRGAKPIWAVVWSNPPPNATSTNFTDSSEINRSQFYRIRSHR